MARQGMHGSPCTSGCSVLTGSPSLPGSRGFLSARGVFWGLGLARPLTRSWRMGGQALGFARAKLREVSGGFAQSWGEECDAQNFFCSAPTFLSAPPASVQAAFAWASSPRRLQGDEDLQPLEDRPDSF